MDPASNDADELAHINRALISAKKRKRYSDKAQHQVIKPFSPQLGKFVLLLFVLANHQAACPIAYIRGLGRTRVTTAHASTEDDELRAIIENLYIESEVHVLACWFETNVRKDNRRVYNAAKYVLEWNMFRWIINANTQKGVAPTIALLEEHFQQLLPASCPANVRDRFLDLMHGAGPHRRRTWLKRFRRRWQIGNGKLKLQQVLTKEEARRKVWVVL
jgi:hypothetical protein